MISGLTFLQRLQSWLCPSRATRFFLRSTHRPPKRENAKRETCLLLHPFGVEGSRFIDPFVGMGPEIVALRLEEICG